MGKDCSLNVSYYTLSNQISHQCPQHAHVDSGPPFATRIGTGFTTITQWLKKPHGQFHAAMYGKVTGF